MGTSYTLESRVNIVEYGIFCDTGCLPHTDADAEWKHGKLVPVEDEYSDADEEVGEIENVGLVAAGEIQDQSNGLEEESTTMTSESQSLDFRSILACNYLMILSPASAVLVRECGLIVALHVLLICLCFIAL